MKPIALLLALAALPAGLHAQLTARQLFYAEGAPATPAPKPAPPKSKKTDPVAKADPKKTPDPVKSVPVDRPAPVPVQLASYAPLALRYSIARLDDGQETEVPVSEVFRSGDQVRLKVETNQAGYLYIVARGSSGIWKPLFPSREASDNAIDARRPYSVPSATHAFTFDDQPGTERLFLLFSRTPVDDLDSLIENLRNRAPAGVTRPEITLAQNLNDGKIDDLRRMYARDLIVEQVSSKQPAASPRPAPKNASPARHNENATYVANASTGLDSRLVADIELNHAAK